MFIHYNLLQQHVETQLERLRGKDGDHYRRLVEGCDAVLQKLRKYMKLAEANPVYLVATVCDPRCNFDFIKWMYQKTPEKIPDAEQKIKSFFETFRNKLDDGCDTLGETDNMESEPDWGNWLSDICSSTSTTHDRGKTSETREDNEYKNYLRQSPVSKETKRMNWWNDYGSKFPTWQKIAFTVLSVPASSAEVERVFSRCFSFDDKNSF